MGNRFRRLLTRMARRIAALTFAGLALALTGTVATAQSWPSRPIRLIVSFPPGGPADLLGRFIAQKLTESTGQQVLVDNRPGANSIIAAEITAKSSPDGYTLLMAIDGALVMNPALYTKLPYDPQKDFAPVSLVARIPNLIVAHPSFPHTSIRDLINTAKARPGSINIATPALPVQLAIELFMAQAGVKLTLVPYKGGNTSITDLVGGNIPLSIEGVFTALPYVRSGRLRALAVSTADRLRQAPEIPTVAESGLPGYDFAYGKRRRSGAHAAEIIDRLNSEIVLMMKTPDAAERLGTLGITPASSTPEELAALIRTDGEKWGKVIRSIGMKIE